MIFEAFSAPHGNLRLLTRIDLQRGQFDIAPYRDERKRRRKIGGEILMLDRSLKGALNGH